MLKSSQRLADSAVQKAGFAVITVPFIIFGKTVLPIFIAYDNIKKNNKSKGL